MRNVVLTPNYPSLRGDDLDDQGQASMLLGTLFWAYRMRAMAVTMLVLASVLGACAKQSEGQKMDAMIDLARKNGASAAELCRMSQDAAHAYLKEGDGEQYRSHSAAQNLDCATAQMERENDRIRAEIREIDRQRGVAK